MLIGKKFIKVNENKEYSVIGTEGAFYILNDKSKVSAQRLLDTESFTEVLDVKNFFEASNNVIVNAVNNTKTPSHSEYNDNVVRVEAKRTDLGDDDKFYANSNESALISHEEIDPEEEKRLLMEKYKIKPHTTHNVISQVEQQNELMKKLIDGDDIQPSMVKNEFMVDEFKQVGSKPSVQIPSPVIDPIIDLLNKTKRVNNLKLKIEIEELLPKNEFIQMLEESYDKSIIDYLTDEIYNKMIEDSNSIKEQIKNQITAAVNKKSTKKK
jgi:hypothetical protein